MHTTTFLHLHFRILMKSNLPLKICKHYQLNHHDLICFVKLFQCHTVHLSVAGRQYVSGNICVDHILELAAFTVNVPTTKSTSLLVPPTHPFDVPSHLPPSVPNSLLYCDSPKSFPSWLCKSTKSHSRLN